MEIIIGLIVLGVIAYFGYKHLNKEKADGSHPLDSVTVAPVVETVPVPEKVAETKVFVDGHGDVRETVPVKAPAVTTAKSSAPKKPKAAKKPAAAKPAGSAKPKAPKKPKMTVVK